ncbi:MAG: response regulator [Verrucomicrobiae bacterium]|nr:response regulator [Verrucomicrobiae bacterium]
MATILLLLENPENLRLLAEELQPRHEVLAGRQEALLSPTVDLLIIDGPFLSRLEEVIRRWKNHQPYNCLPVLLVTTRPDVGLATRALWKTVDELIQSPIEKVELHARVENLLLQRRLSLDLHRSVVQHSPLSIMVLDADGKLCLWNASAERLFGWPVVEVLDRPPPLVPDSERHVFDELVRRVLRGETFREFELHLQKRGGELVEGLVSATPLRDVEQQVSHVLLSFLELTALRQAEAEKKKMEAELVQAQKMEAVGRLAGGGAHDFNNMLSVIMSTAEMAMEELPADHPLRGDLLEIHHAARRSADLTSRLLAFARKQVIHPKALDLNSAINNTLKMLQRLIGEDIKLTWEPGPNLWPVFMDPGQLDQILMNLAVNARDAIQNVGRITIATENFTADDSFCQMHQDARPGDYVRLSFADNGCGIPPEVKARIFEPFFTTKEPGKGTGMGLATVFGIVKQNQGVISVYSEPGLGTVFRIYLPRHQEKGEPETAAPPVAAPHGHETILLVEDEPSLLKLTRAMLERLGYKVLSAARPQEALRLVNDHPGDIHLVISDVILPESSALEMVQKIQELRPGVRCLYMSGYTADIMLQRGMHDKNVIFLQKPFTPQSLAAKVREALSA